MLSEAAKAAAENVSHSKPHGVCRMLLMTRASHPRAEP